MIVFFLFILGLCMGSFLNVVAYRLPSGLPIAKGRSQCDFCHHILAWYDLIPLFSFLLLRCRCRYCHKKLSWHYPLSELLTGGVFVFTYEFAPLIKTDMLFFGISLMLYLVIAACLLAIVFADSRYGIIPDELLVVSLLVALLLFALQPAHILPGLIAAGSAGGFFLFLFLATKGKGMGFGDVKLAVLMGLVLGLPDIIIALYAAFLTGAFIALILILCRKKKFLGSTIAFGPFLIFGTFVSLWFGTPLWQMLLHIMGIQ